MPERIDTLPSLPDRAANAHKGTFGRVLIAAGSRGLSGAAVLSGLGALRGGAGLVTVASPRSVVDIIAASEPSYLTLSLPEDAEGRIGLGALVPLWRAATSSTSMAIGPGWGTSASLDVLAERCYLDLELPLVVDADALNALARARRLMTDDGNPVSPMGPRVLTPHPGELARLLELDIEEIGQRREELTVEFARRLGAVVLLKGPGTVISDGERLAINKTGNSGLATGGTGDVLTGLVAALLAAGLDAFEAAWLGAHLHGLAGDLATVAGSAPALIASDLPDWLSAAWQQLGEGEGPA